VTDLLDQLLARDGMTRGDLMGGSGEIAKRLRKNGITRGPELERVLSVPRREPAGDELVPLLSAALRLRPDDPTCPLCGPYTSDFTCHLCSGTGRIELREAQAIALREVWERRGLVAHMRVGSGKTLVTLLAPTLLRVQRPVLMVPAALREKTRRDFAVLRQAWHLRMPEIISYQEMGRPDREFKLINTAPDLLILDEFQGARNWDAAVTRRIERLVQHHAPIVMALSGTLITDDLMDYWHALIWALRQGAPVPLPRAETERWQQALHQGPALRKIARGALDEIPGGHAEWLRESAGVVTTPGSDCDAAIEIGIWAPDTPDPLRKVIEDTEIASMRPDGELIDQWELADCLCQLALGFYYVWDPMPPDWWLGPRRAWRAYVRDVLDERHDRFDSESLIVNALDRGTSPLPPEWRSGRALLAAWRDVRDRFEPNPVPVWLDRSIIKAAAEHTREHNAIAWTRYRAAGFALDAAGVPYYPGGVDPESATPGTPIACSIAAHGTGRNMQAWCRSLVLTPPANANAWEQLIGRTHRPGQRADVVGIDVIGTIEYHGAVLGRVTAKARAVSRASGFSQKVVDATWR
jgi:hypothetical protein